MRENNKFKLLILQQQQQPIGVKIQTGKKGQSNVNIWKQGQNGGRRDLKNILKLIAIIFAILILLNGWNFYKYWEISQRIKKQQIVQPDELINVLNYLTSTFFFPKQQEFYEEFILQLTRLSQWKLVIQKAEQALSYSSNRNKFSIYYHKSMAECQTDRFKACLKSAMAAFDLADQTKSIYLDQIFQILVSNNIMKQHEVPKRGDIIQLGKPVPLSSRKNHLKPGLNNLQTL